MVKEAAPFNINLQIKSTHPRFRIPLKDPLNFRSKTANFFAETRPIRSVSPPQIMGEFQLPLKNTLHNGATRVPPALPDGRYCRPGLRRIWPAKIAHQRTSKSKSRTGFIWITGTPGGCVAHVVSSLTCVLRIRWRINGSPHPRRS